jgi:hypothetical protein
MGTVKKDVSARRAIRVPVELRGSLRHRVSWDVTVQDLSVTGCLLQCPGDLDPGAIVDVSLEMGPRLLAAKARVVDAAVDGEAPAGRSRYLVGLEFLGLPAREETNLRAFLDEESQRVKARPSGTRT